MSTFISDNQKFHIFSKSPVRAGMGLGQANNKSGHTIVSEEVRTTDIPWFIKVQDVSQPPEYAKNARVNDIIYEGSFDSLTKSVKCKKWDGTAWVDDPNLDLATDPILKNENGDNAIQVYFNCDVEYINHENNADTYSNKQSAFVVDNITGNYLTHFVSSTDKIHNGISSNGYGLYLFKDGVLLDETDSSDDGYIVNSVAGIIQFNKARTEKESSFKAIAFKYIGGYLDKSLKNFKNDLTDYIDEKIEEHNEEFDDHKNNVNPSEQHLSESEVESLDKLVDADKITAVNVSSEHYDGAISLEKVLKCDTTTADDKGLNFKTVGITLSLRDEVLQQSALPVTSKAIYNHVHKQSVDIEKASNNVTVKEVTTNENERRKYTIAVDGYTTSETDNIVDDIYEKIQATADDINRNVVEHTSNNGIHITDTERESWNNNEVVLQKHLNDQNSHVSEADRELWNSGGNMQITGDDFINPELIEGGWDISLNTTTTIDTDNNTNDAKTVPTVGAVKTYVDNLIDGYAKESSDIIWNLNDLLVSCINDTDKNGAKWVQELLRANANNNSTLISIINYESIYNTTNIVEATEKWIAEACAEGSDLSTQLAFKQDSFMTNQLFRLFFYNLDHKLGKIYGADDSISRKFMKRGLTFKYLTKVEGDPVLNYPNEGFGKSRYKYITLRYRGKTIDGTDKPLEIDWNHVPTIANTVNSSSTADTFQMAKAWDIIDSEEYNTPDSDISSIIGETISEEPSNWDIETSFTDSATNVYNFTCNSPFSGILTEVRLHCAPPGKGETTLSTYLEIRQGDKILARSTNSQEHGQGNILRFNFDNVLISYNEKYGFYIVNADGSTASSSCLALKKKVEVPEVANLNVMVGGYLEHTPRFGFTYYKSNRKIINSSLDKLDCNLVYDISYNYSNTNNIQSVRNRSITFADGSTTDFPINKITHAKYAFRTKSGTTPVLTEFNLRDIDGGKPGNNYDEKYYYERDVRKSSYDEDAGGNIETLGNLINGDGMFIRSGITTFNDDLSCLIRARQMFTNSQLVSFRSALPSLTFADRMFLGTKLTEFKVKLPNLSSAECMFRLCENLKFVDTCFPNLTFAQGMFGLCNNLERVDLSASSGSNLYLADDMFAGCEKLKTVKINLSYLENAKNMFGPANNKVASLLDIESVKYIANTIKDWNNDYYTDRVHELTLGIDLVNADYETSSYKQYIEQIADKNWKVTVYTSDSRNNPAFIVVK